MVALTSHFAALSTFVALAFFSFAPVPTDAVAIPKPGPLAATSLPATIGDDTSPHKNAVQARSLDYTQNIVEFARAVSNKSLYQRPCQGKQPSRRSLTSNKQAVFGVHRRHAETIKEEGTLGEVSIIDTQGSFITNLKAFSKDGICILGAAENTPTPTPFTLLLETSRRAKSAGSVILMVPDCENPSEHKYVTYNCATPGPFTLEKRFVDKAEDSGQMFTWNETTGVLEANECTSAPVDSGSQPQKVIQGKGEEIAKQPQNVRLKFSPLKAVNAQAMAPPSAVASTTTMTVTVTGSPTASLSAAAEADATPSDSSSALTTSTADLSTPTASVAPAFVVLEDSSLSNATATATSEPVATPSTTMNIEEIASSIAASTVTDAPLGPTATANATSSAAVAMEVSSSLLMSMSSSTESSAPTPSAESVL